jgi:hypothetical protein
MTEVTFFEDFHCFEYHTPRGAAQRFRYFLYSPVYECIPLSCRATTSCECPPEQAVYSSQFLPLRLGRGAGDGAADDREE